MLPVFLVYAMFAECLCMP